MKRTTLILHGALVYVLFFFVGCILLNSCGSSTGNDNAVIQPSGLGLTQILKKYRNEKNVRNIVVVRCRDSTRPTLLLYHKNPQNNAWSLIHEAQANIGANGVTFSKVEGDGKTPLGDFGIVTAFGIQPAPQTSLSFMRVTPTVYAVDTERRQYNKIVNAAYGGVKEGEHMYDFSPRYNYGIALDYNKKGVKGKGSNIFLRCKEDNGPTPGGIAVDEDIVLSLIKTLTPYDRICIIP